MASMTKWGGGMLLAVLIFAAAGPLAAPYGREESESFIILGEGEDSQILAAPHAPSRRHPLGSDPWGKDLLSLMMYGARYTLGICLGVAFLRVLLGTVWGIARGMAGSRENALGAGGSGGPGRKGRRGLLSDGAGGIPVFVLLYFILFGINFNPVLAPPVLAFLQGGLLVLFGLPPVAATVREKTVSLRGRDYFEAGVAVGAGKGRLIRYYLLPFLKETFLVLFSQETTAVLTLIGQLGVFHIFIGGTRMHINPMEYHSITHEWAGLVGQYRSRIQGDSWWVIWVPLAGYLLVLLAFFLITRGLEQRYGNRYNPAAGSLG